MMLASGTALSGAETVRWTATTDGYANVNARGLTEYPVSSYTNIAATYHSGSVDVYTYNSGTTPVGTITVTYTDATKGSISTVVYS